MIISRLGVFSVTAAALSGVLLSGCVNNTALDDLRETSSPPVRPSIPHCSTITRHWPIPSGKWVPRPRLCPSTAKACSMQLTSMDSKIGALANAYAEKALIAARGSVVEPEPGVDVPTHKMRDRLIRALERGRETYPCRPCACASGLRLLDDECDRAGDGGGFASVPFTAQRERWPESGRPKPSPHRSRHPHPHQQTAISR